MKVIVKNISEEFHPYEVCFKINSVEDSIEFHDRVAIKISNDNVDLREFRGHIYNRNKNGVSSPLTGIFKDVDNDRKDMRTLP